MECIDFLNVEGRMTAGPAPPSSRVSLTTGAIHRCRGPDGEGRGLVAPGNARTWTTGGKVGFYCSGPRNAVSWRDRTLLTNPCKARNAQNFGTPITDAEAKAVAGALGKRPAIRTMLFGDPRN